jgi:hypothetical protein
MSGLADLLGALTAEPPAARPTAAAALAHPWFSGAASGSSTPAAPSPSTSPSSPAPPLAAADAATAGKDPAGGADLAVADAVALAAAVVAPLVQTALHLPTPPRVLGCGYHAAVVEGTLSGDAGGGGSGGDSNSCGGSSNGGSSSGGGRGNGGSNSGGGRGRGPVAVAVKCMLRGGDCAREGRLLRRMPPHPHVSRVLC